MARRTAITTTVELSGPFFARDPTKVLKSNITEMLELAAQEIAESVKANYRKGEARRLPVRPISRNARVSHFIRGRVTSIDPPGRKWRYTAIVSPSRQGLSKGQAIALNAAAARVERQMRVWRKHRRVTRSASRNITKGLN